MGWTRHAKTAKAKQGGQARPFFCLVCVVVDLQQRAQTTSTTIEFLACSQASRSCSYTWRIPYVVRMISGSVESALWIVYRTKAPAIVNMERAREIEGRAYQSAAAAAPLPQSARVAHVDDAAQIERVHSAAAAAVRVVDAAVRDPPVIYPNYPRE